MAGAQKFDYGVLALGILLVVFSAQPLSWIKTRPPGASTLRATFVILQIVLTLGGGIGMIALSAFRYFRTR